MYINLSHPRNAVNRTNSYYLYFADGNRSRDKLNNQPRYLARKQAGFLRPDLWEAGVRIFTLNHSVMLLLTWGSKSIVLLGTEKYSPGAWLWMVYMNLRERRLEKWMVLYTLHCLFLFSASPMIFSLLSDFICISLGNQVQRSFYTCPSSSLFSLLASPVKFSILWLLAISQIVTDTSVATKALPHCLVITVLSQQIMGYLGVCRD